MTLHDIFPSVEIVEYSLYYFLFFLLFFIVGLWYLIPLYLKHKKKTRGYYITLLENSIGGKAKHIAHKFSYYGKYVVHTSQQEEKLQQLLELLEPFKYQEDSATLDHHIHKQLLEFLKILRHKDV